MKYSTRSAAAATFLLSLSPLALADGDNCITFKGDKSYTWKADGDFAGPSGTVDGAQHCFGPGSGGISFGAPGATTPGMSGNTRLECHFPPGDGTDADFYNCNLSLVDGFSAAVTCTVAGGGWPNSNDATAPLGCGYDLLGSCPPENYDGGCKCCKNPQGATANDIGGVAAGFAKCDSTKENPNSAEVYHSMKGAYKFQKSDFPITCTVGKGEAPKVKRVVDMHHGAHLMHAHGSQQHRVARSPVHTRDVKARGLADTLS